MNIFNCVFLEFKEEFANMSDKDKNEVKRYYFHSCKQFKLHHKFLPILLADGIEDKETVVSFVENIDYFQAAKKHYVLEHELLRNDFFLSTLFVKEIIRKTETHDDIYDIPKIFDLIMHNYFSSEKKGKLLFLKDNVHNISHHMDSSRDYSKTIKSILWEKDPEIIFPVLDLLKERLSFLFPENMSNIDYNSAHNIFTVNNISIINKYIDLYHSDTINEEEKLLINQCAFVMSYTFDDYFNTLQRMNDIDLHKLIENSLSLFHLKGSPLFESVLFKPTNNVFNRVPAYKTGIPQPPFLYTKSWNYVYEEEIKKIDFVLENSQDNFKSVCDLFFIYNRILSRNGFPVSAYVDGVIQPTDTPVLAKISNYLFDQLVNISEKENKFLDLDYFLSRNFHIFPENAESFQQLLLKAGDGSLNIDTLKIVFHGYNRSTRSEKEIEAYREKLKETQIAVQKNSLSKKIIPSCKTESHKRI